MQLASRLACLKKANAWKGAYASRIQQMHERAYQLNTVQQIREEFRIITLTAAITIASIWLFVSMNLLSTGVVYFGFLVVISLIYAAVDYFGHDAAEIKNNG